MNFGPVTPEFKKGKDVYPSSISSLAIYAAPLLDIAEISTEFSGTITTQFCFTYTLDGVTAMRAGYRLGSATHSSFNMSEFRRFSPNFTPKSTRLLTETSCLYF